MLLSHPSVVLFQKRKGINAAVTLGKLLLPEYREESILGDPKLQTWHFCFKEKDMTTEELRVTFPLEGGIKGQLLPFDRGKIIGCFWQPSLR